MHLHPTHIQKIQENVQQQSALTSNLRKSNKYRLPWMENTFIGSTCHPPSTIMPPIQALIFASLVTKHWMLLYSIWGKSCPFLSFMFKKLLSASAPFNNFWTLSMIYRLFSSINSYCITILKLPSSPFNQQGSTMHLVNLLNYYQQIRHFLFSVYVSTLKLSRGLFSCFSLRFFFKIRGHI